MERSRLRLETYHITKIAVLPRPDGDGTPLGQYADFTNVDFASEVSLQPLNDTDGPDGRQGLELELTVRPKDGSTFPYDVNVSVFGVFDANDLPEARREVLVLVNGASMLYSALRELLLTLTHRCIHGPVMLPSVNFVGLEKDFENDKAEKTKTQTQDITKLPAPPLAKG